MNKLSLDRKAQIIKVLCEGNSIRSTARITNTAINTVVNLLKDAGDACAKYQDIHLRNLPCKTIQCDEIWSFCYSKQKNVPEDKLCRKTESDNANEHETIYKTDQCVLKEDR